MSKRVERFKKRKLTRDAFKKKAHLKSISDSDLVKNFISQKVDSNFIKKHLNSESHVYELDVSDSEVKKSLELLDKDFTKDKYDVLFESGKEVLIDQLLKPLKLSRADISNVDRDFEYHRGDYTKSSKAIGGESDSFSTVRDRNKVEATNESGQIQDTNTGLWHDASEMDLDHNKPLENFHNSGGYMLNDVEKREFGADSDNHDFTHNSANRSKGSRDHKEFSDNQENKEKFNLDNRRTNAAHRRGEKATEKYVPTGNLEKTVFISKKAAQDGVEIGTSQGLQQALGTLLSEFITATFSEVKDIFSNGWKNGKYNDTWIEILKIRMGKIKNKLLKSWKNVATSFGTGTLSGFLSAIITALINMFVRTGKNIVRLIREGFMSLMKAVKTLLFPPEGMSLKQAAHEATKVLATGLVITGGILAGESISTLLNGIPFADTISIVLSGLISGLGSLFVVFMLDKLDLFGVNAEERHLFIMGKLEKNIETDIEKMESTIQSLDLNYR